MGKHGKKSGKSDKSKSDKSKSDKSKSKSKTKGSKHHVSRKAKSNAAGWACASLLTSLTAIVLGIIILINCMTPTLGKLYLAEIRKNVTHDVKLRIGYFGGCVSVANIPNESGISIDDSSDPSQTHCVVNMRGHDEDDLSEEFWEGFDLDTPAMNSLNATLNEILPLVRHLQKDVFNYAAPLAHVVLFVVSAIMLGVAAVGSSARRGYRVALVLAVIVSAFALSLALDTALGSARALNALIDGNGDTEGRKLYDGLYINRAHVLERIQAVQVSIVAVFYVIMGAMYALR